MKQRIVLMLICCFSLWGGNLSADDDFNPPNPEEPATIDFCRLTVSADPEESAYVSGSGKYRVTGGSVYISTSARNTEDYEYTFKYWTLNGEVTSYSQNLYFTPVKGTYELVAHYDKKEIIFDPDDPAEPSSTNIKKKYYLTLTSNIEGACSFNISSGKKYEEGSSIYVVAYVNTSYYTFEGWKLNGTLVSTSQNFYLTMPSSNSTLEACVAEIPFNPDDPAEPNGGGDINMPIRQINNIAIGYGNVEADRTRVVFNEEKSLDYEVGTDAAKMLSNDADYQIYTLDGKGTKYSINERPLDNGEVPVGIVVKEAGQVTIFATRLDCSLALIDKEKGITRNLAAHGYTFTSAAGTFENRFVLTTSIPDVLRGDANGDGNVTITDAVAIVNSILGNESENFVFDAADVNKDGHITITDAVGVVNIILNK